MSETRLYLSVNVPILHKDWHGKYSLSSIFLNPKIMGVSLMYAIASETDLFTQIYVALIHGLGAAKGFMKDGSVQSQTEMMVALTHSIRNITPGTIAMCGILVCSCYLY